MIKLFGKTRKQLIAENRIGKYLKYAIGEIALVVIGILIAVSINNWNEGRKQEKALKNILATVATDIAQDTASLKSIIDHYQNREAAFLHIINDSLTREEVIECEVCPFLASSYRVFTPNIKGYDLLREFVDFNETSQDTVAANIIFVYSRYITEFERWSDMISSNVTGNLVYWRDRYPWYANFLMRRFDETYYDYVFAEADYKNRVAHQYVLVYENYLRDLRNFNRQIKDILAEIHKRTDE